MLNEENRALVEIVDGWALAEESDLPLDRIEAIMNAVRREERKRAIELITPFLKQSKGGVAPTFVQIRQANAYVAESQDNGQ